MENQYALTEYGVQPCVCQAATGSAYGHRKNVGSESDSFKGMGIGKKKNREMNFGSFAMYVCVFAAMVVVHAELMCVTG
jgi:hypothetical protein